MRRDEGEGEVFEIPSDVFHATVNSDRFSQIDVHEFQVENDNRNTIKGHRYINTKDKKISEKFEGIGSKPMKNQTHSG